MTAASDPPGGAETQHAGPTVVPIGSLQPHAGKTALVSAISVRLAYAGRRMLALRLASEEDALSAEADATVFKALPFARGRGGKPISAEEAAAAARELAQTGGVLMLEAPNGADLAALAGSFDAAVIIALRSADAEAMKVLAELAEKIGPKLLGVVAMAVPQPLMR